MDRGPAQRADPLSQAVCSAYATASSSALQEPGLLGVARELVLAGVTNLY
ncbi:hypothetical protein ACFRJ1_14220 [Streptomyces sp. NPDC056773]